MKRIHYTPLVGDGLDNLGTFVESLDKWDLSMVYEEVHNAIGCGNFVVVLSLKLFAGRSNAVIDIFCVGDGKIVENWDAKERSCQRSRGSTRAVSRERTFFSLELHRTNSVQRAHDVQRYARGVLNSTN
jgi:predicted SnoaL-like aldol condensation-catalyzing enzyme